MVACTWCGLDMTTADGCTDETIDLAGQEYQRIRYGYEVYREVDMGAWVENYRKPDRCHDCGAKLGQLHHANCDNEQCARCRGQFLSCGCYWIGRESEDD